MTRAWIPALAAILAASCGGSSGPNTASPTTTSTPAASSTSTQADDRPSTGEWSAEITFEWSDSGCAGLQFSRLHKIDVPSGDIDWSVDTPWAPNGPVVLDGGTVVLVDKSYETPSIVGYDLATGAGVWQRAMDGSFVELAASDGERAAIVVFGQGRFGDPRVLLVDAEGTATESAVSVGGVAHNDQGPEWWQSRYVIGPDGAAWDPFAEPAVALGASGFSDYQPVVIGDAAITTQGPRVGFADRDTSWETTVLIDDEFSEVRDVRVGAETVLVLVGSDLGPNRRLVVLDRVDGSLRWTLDGVRDADVAGDRVIYDRRTEVPSGNGPTREVFLVDQVDPAAVVWSALADAPLGGFLGTLGGQDHFVHRDPSIWPRAPYPEVGAVTEVQTFEPELLVVGDDGPGEVPMHGGSRDLRRAPGPDTAAGDGWTAVTIGELVWITSAEGTTTVDLGSTPRHLLGVGTALVATTGAPEIGCD